MRTGIKHLLWVLPLLGLLGFVGYRVREKVRANAELQQGGAPGQGGPGGQAQGGQGQGRPGGQGGQGGGPGGGGPGGGGGGRAQVVQTDKVASGKIAEKIQLTGALKAKDQVDVMPRIGGRITKLTLDVGQQVKRGALVAQIEDDEIIQQIERSKASLAVVDASIAQREAELNNAKTDLERRKKLIDEGVLPKSEIDTLETRLRVAQSQLELTRAQRRQSEAEQRELNIRHGQTKVYAPLTGVVSRRQLDLGAMAGANTPIVTIVSENPMVIEAKTSERDIARIRRGAVVKVTIDSLPGQNFTGRVLRIAPQLDPQTRNGIVEIEIPNRNGALKGEMFARAELNLGSERMTTLLPRDALVYRGEQPGVYVIENNAAKFLPLETGLTQEDKVEVVNGLKVGDVVITRGSNLIKEGDRVRVQEARGPGGEGGGQGGQPRQGQAAANQSGGGQGQRPQQGPGGGPPQQGGQRPQQGAGGQRER
jgi:RND family efflux transporter MFP subunit